MVFGDLLQLIIQVHELRLRIEGAILDLPKEFNECFRRTTLRFRPWRRKKGDPPFALYWIHLPHRRQIIEDFIQRAIRKLDRRPRWHFRLKIRTSRDLDRAIHRGGLDYARREVHRFHRRAQSLNQAHKTLTGLLDSIRKMLESKAGGKLIDFNPGACPSELATSFPSDIRKVVELMWRLDRLVRHRQSHCHDLARAFRHKPRWMKFRVTFSQDREHPHGRFLWLCQETGRTYTALGDRDRRRLGIAERVSREISPVETVRRRLGRALMTSVALVRRIKLKVPPAIRQATALLAAADGVNQKEVVG